MDNSNTLIGHEWIETLILRYGTVSALAEVLKVSAAAISSWRYMRAKPSAERAIEIEKLTGMPRELIRPDLFGHQYGHHNTPRKLKKFAEAIEKEKVLLNGGKENG
ncbi:hypothetical protein D6827_02340 [Candidatus Parcubacteria bacterium]|nr:MAG: hypothetical protein D6827_02340 [Candidatus Parcubacteria bacterium]